MMRHDPQPQVYAAPEPVLGLVTSGADVEEARVRRTGRVAMGFAAAGAVGGAIACVGLFGEAVGKARHSGVDVFLGLLLFLTPVLMLLGLILGTVARKSRTGKAAIAVSLAPLAMVAFFFLAAVVVGVIAGLKTA